MWLLAIVVASLAAPSDDGFAKVEAKLKALEEKMKADAAKFEAEAKAPASSFVQTSDAPSDDGFAKVEAKLKALEEKMKADETKDLELRQKVQAPASSLAQLHGDDWLRGEEHKQSLTDRAVAKDMARLLHLSEKRDRIPTHNDAKRLDLEEEGSMKTFAAESSKLEQRLAKKYQGVMPAAGSPAPNDDAAPHWEPSDASFLQTDPAPDTAPGASRAYKDASTPKEDGRGKIEETSLDSIDAKLAAIGKDEKETDAEEDELKKAYHQRSGPSSFIQRRQRNPLDDRASALDFQEQLNDVRAQLQDVDGSVTGPGSVLETTDALTDSVPASAVDARRGLDLDSPAFKALLMGEATVGPDGVNLRKA